MLAAFVGVAPAQTQRARTGLAVLAVVMLGCGWLGVAVDHAVETPAWVARLAGSSLGTVLWLGAPTAAGLYLLAAHRDRLRDLGMSPRAGQVTVKAGWIWLLAVLVYPAFAVAVSALAVVADASDPPVLTPAAREQLVQAALSVAPVAMLAAVAVELVLRGFGTPAAVGLTRSVWVAHAVVGLLWFGWYAPYLAYLLPRSDLRMLTSLPLPAFLAMTAVGLLVLSYLLGEIRLLTDSIWPGVLLHLTAAVSVATALSPRGLTLDPWADALLSPAPHSVAAVVLVLVTGNVVRRWRALA